MGPEALCAVAGFAWCHKEVASVRIQSGPAAKPSSPPKISQSRLGRSFHYHHDRHNHTEQVSTPKLSDSDHDSNARQHDWSRRQVKALQLHIHPLLTKNRSRWRKGYDLSWTRNHCNSLLTGVQCSFPPSTAFSSCFSRAQPLASGCTRTWAFALKASSGCAHLSPRRFGVALTTSGLR